MGGVVCVASRVGRAAAAILGVAGLGFFNLGSVALAQDATWLASPGSADFNTNGNWSPATVPTGNASFGASNRTSLTFSAGTTTLNSLLFNNGASAYTFGVGGQSLTLTNGLTNNSSQMQTFTAGASGNITFDGGSAGNSVFSVSGSAAQLNFFGTSNASSATITVSGGASLNADDSADMGSATVTLSGTGTTMCFCNDANPNKMTVTVNTGATLQLQGNNASNTMRYIGGGGTFDLSSMGAASVTIGSIEGSGSINLGANNLTVGASNLSTTFSGVISDGGSAGTFTKLGSGTLTLSGANTFTGLTTVSAGTLLLTGSLAGAATVSSGGTFKGTGTVGGNFINNGIVAPGSSVGTLTVNGTFTQGSGGTYQVELNGNQSDRLKVTGTATLAGAVSVSAPSGSFLLNNRYTILNSTGGISGTFGSVSAFGLVRPTLSYDANNAFLTLSLASNAFQSVAQNPNQASVGRVLDQSAATATGDFNAAISAIAGLNPSQMPAALDAIAGQNYSGFSTVAVQSVQAFMASFSQQAGTGSGSDNRVAVAQGSDVVCGLESCDLTATRWGAWGGGIGGAGTVAGNVDSHGVSYSLGGFATGLDYRFDPRFLAGVTAGFTSSTLYTQGMSGRGTSDTFQFGFYGSFTPGPFYVDALAGYARSQNQQQRPIIISSLSTRTALGSTSADQFFGQLEGGYPIALGGGGEANAAVTPFARLQGSTSTQAAFSESGADSLNLTIAQQTTNSLRTILGVQLSGNVAKVTTKVRLGWSHEYADTSRPVTASFAGAPQLGFTTQGANAPRDGAILGLGLDTSVAEATRLYARYDGEIQGGNTSHIFSAGVRMVW